MFHVDPVMVLEETDELRASVRLAAVQLVARWRNRDPQDVPDPTVP